MYLAILFQSSFCWNTILLCIHLWYNIVCKLMLVHRLLVNTASWMDEFLDCSYLNTLRYLTISSTHKWWYPFMRSDQCFCSCAISWELNSKASSVSLGNWLLNSARHTDALSHFDSTRSTKDNIGRYWYCHSDSSSFIWLTVPVSTYSFSIKTCCLILFTGLFCYTYISWMTWKIPTF